MGYRTIHVQVPKSTDDALKRIMQRESVNITVACILALEAYDSGSRLQAVEKRVAVLETMFDGDGR